MTLTEAAFWTKRFGVIALGLIVVLVLGVLILTYEPPATAPEKYLKPNFACTEKREEFLETGVLEIPSLKLAEGSNMLFEINTDTGKINDAIEIVNMYAYNNPTQAWDARLRAKALATKLGFEGDRISREREGFYEWENSAFRKTLSVNAKNQNFSMKTDTLFAKRIGETGSLPSEQEAKSKARNALSSLSLLNSDFSSENNVSYITINPDGSFSKALSSSEAHLVKVDFVREKSLVTINSDIVNAKDIVKRFEDTIGQEAVQENTIIDDKKVDMYTFNTRVVLPKSQESNISVYVGVENKDQRGAFASIYQIDYTYWPLAVESCGTYKLITPQIALNRIQNGEGSIAYLYDANGDDISEYSPRVVKKFIVNQNMRLFYYESPEEQDFLQPVYVLSGETIFEGDVTGRFDIYYPAIDYSLVQDKIELPEPVIEEKKGLLPT